MSAFEPASLPFSHHVAMASTWLRSSSVPRASAVRARARWPVDRIGAARAVGPFCGDHRERDVCARMIRVFGDGGGEGDGCAVLHGE